MDQARRWGTARDLLGWLAAVALMLLVVTTTVRFAANSLTVYDALFERHQVSLRTGITAEGLRGVGAQIQDYFNSDREPLVVIAEVNGVAQSLFGPDEAAHMADVKQLFLKTYRTQAASALFLVVAAGVVLAVRRRSGLADIAGWLRRGGVVTMATIGVLGIASVVAFGPVFELFHRLGFPQGNYRFDPATDYLVRVFPFGFWQEITLLIGALSLIAGALLLLAGVWAPRVERRVLARDTSVRQTAA